MMSSDMRDRLKDRLVKLVTQISNLKEEKKEFVAGHNAAIKEMQATADTISLAVERDDVTLLGQLNWE